MAKREGSPVRGREGLNSLGSVGVVASFSVDGAGVLLSDVEVEGVLAVFGFLVR